jgi:hypothetical protein
VWFRAVVGGERYFSAEANDRYNNKGNKQIQGK